MQFARRVFLIAGIYGLVLMLPQYFLEEQVGRETPPAITHPEYFYGFIGTVVAFQCVFLLVARDPVRYRPIMLPSILEKAGFGGATVVLYLHQRLAATTLAFGLIDLTLGTLFVVAYLRTSESSRTSVG